MDFPSLVQEGKLYEVFCHMMIEDFLSRHGMHNTLRCFRDEWDRPNEEQVCDSWFEIALKLRLPELISQNSKNLSIMENLVQALVREASVRCRQSPQVLMTGLAALPRASSLPTIVDLENTKAHFEGDSSPLYSPTMKSGKEHALNRSMQRNEMPGMQSTLAGRDGGGKEPGTKEKNSHHHQQHHRQGAPPSKQSVNRVKPVLQFSSAGTSGGSALQHHHFSNENWIPDDIRMRSMLRDLTAAKETFTAIRKRETEYEREMKRLLVSDLERAKTEESLDATRKIPCGCCTQMFLYVNLPLKVSRKAILDIRIKWSGKLSSATVFDPIGQVIADDEYDKRNMSSSRSKSKTAQLLSGGNLGQIQTDYRPSYEEITYQERKAAYLETKRREREYWNPLKMIEKDRDAAAASASVHTVQAFSSDPNDESASNAGGGSTHSSVDPDK